MSAFHARILTAERVFFDGECEALTFPTTDGLFGLLAHHAPLVCAVVPGELTIRKADGGVLTAAVAAGMLRFRDNEALLLTDTAEPPEEIDLRRAERAALAAKEALRHKQSAREYREAEIRLSRAISRMNVKKHRH